MVTPVKKILVVDDHALVREGLMKTVSQLEDGITCSGAENADEALRLLQEDSYCLMLLDLMLPGINGMAFLGVLRKRYPGLPVVILSALDDPDTVGRAMRQGASGFVPKSSSGEELLAALRSVLAGEVFVPKHLSKVGGSGRSLTERYGITAGQMRVLELLRQGKTNREIANLLGLTEGTVKIHVSAIFKALNVTNRSQALLVANRQKSARI